jgi:hypothetical protein
MSSQAALKLRQENEIRKHLKPIFMEMFYGETQPEFFDHLDGSFTFLDYDTNNDFVVFVEGYKCYTKFPIKDEYY